MNRLFSARSLSIFAAALLGFSAITASAADMKDNPKYQAWSKFKAGSFNTIATDIQRGPNTFHMEITRKLISIDAKEAVVETTVVATVAGHDHAMPSAKETIPAQTDKDEIKATGDSKDVEAMGKTFKCKVWERAADATATPDAHAAPGMDASKKATVYASEDVPGGIVKMVSTDRTDKEISFVLSAMEAK